MNQESSIEFSAVAETKLCKMCLIDKPVELFSKYRKLHKTQKVKKSNEIIIIEIKKDY
jgi:hypothetical protein